MSAAHDQIVFWIVEQIPRLASEHFSSGWSDEERALWESAGNKALPEQRLEWTTEWERPITVPTRPGMPPRIEGYIDLTVTIRQKAIHNEDDGVFLLNPVVAVWHFEAKPKIESLGEVLRQIKRYAVFLGKSSTFYVVSPDAKHARVLEEQGVRFLHAFGGQLHLDI